MNIQINELADGRAIGCGVFEIASFPAIEGSAKEVEAALEQASIEGIYEAWHHVRIP
jgi:hypothetical protein